jgi:hypothetical protein
MVYCSMFTQLMFNLRICIYTRVSVYWELSVRNKNLTTKPSDVCLTVWLTCRIKKAAVEYSHLLNTVRSTRLRAASYCNVARLQLSSTTVRSEKFWPEQTPSLKCARYIMYVPKSDGGWLHTTACISSLLQHVYNGTGLCEHSPVFEDHSLH